MNARALGATKVFAWPDAQVAVMGAVAAVRILHRRKLADVPEDARAAVEAELAEEHARIAGGVDKAVAIGVVDEMVEPSRTRSAIAEAIGAALAADPDVRGHHGQQAEDQAAPQRHRRPGVRDPRDHSASPALGGRIT